MKTSRAGLRERGPGKPMNGGMDGECRTCLGSSQLAKELFVEHEPKIFLYQIINNLCNLEICRGDGLGKYICDSCHQNVLEFNTFKKTSHQSFIALISIWKKLGKYRVKSISHLCRLCVNESHLYLHILNQKHKGISWHELINDVCCLDVSTGDNLPLCICRECFTKVTKFYNFKTLAHQRNIDLTTMKVHKKAQLKEWKRAISTQGKGAQVDSKIPTDQSGSNIGDIKGAGNAGTEDADERVREYQQYVKYTEFTDFLDTYLPMGDKDSYLFTDVILRELAATSASGELFGDASKCDEIKRSLKDRLAAKLESLRASQVTESRIHEMRLEALAVEKEIYAVRKAMDLERSIHEKKMMLLKEQVREVASEVKSSKSKSKDSPGSSVDEGRGDAPAEPFFEPCEPQFVKVKIEHEPDDLFEVEEFNIKEEPLDDGYEPRMPQDDAEFQDQSGNQEPGSSFEHSHEEDVQGNSVGGSSSNEEGRGNMRVTRKRKNIGINAGVEGGRSKDYSEETLLRAAKMIKVHRWSVWNAASYFNIPWAIMREYMKNVKDSGDLDEQLAKRWPLKFHLSPRSESVLLDFVAEMKLRGYGVCRDRIRRMAYVLAEREQEESGNATGFTDAKHCANAKWTNGFVRRHKVNLIQSEPPRVRPDCRPDCEALEGFYMEVRRLHDQLGVAVKPTQVWNCDEMTFCCAVKKSEAVLLWAGKGDLCEVAPKVGAKLQVNTVLTCANAAGRVGPTMIVSQKDQVGAPNMSAFLPSMSLTSSDTGFLDLDLFMVWFQMFARAAQVDRPVILLLDLHKNHLSPEVIDSAGKNGVVIAAIPFHASGMLQPIQFSMLHPLQSSLEQNLSNLQRNQTQAMKESAFSSVFELLFKSVITEENIIAGFCKTGLYPPHPMSLSSSNF